jgi:outer membrane protein TolC
MRDRHVFALSALLLSATCLAQSRPPSPDHPWVAPDAHLQDDLSSIPENSIKMDPSQTYTLGDLIDIAEQHNPQTRLAWSRAKAQAAAVGIARSELFPTLVATVMSETSTTGLLLNNQFVLQTQGLYEPQLSLTYLIFDFGARTSRIASSRANLLGANLAFNNTHLTIIDRVTQAFYRLQNANAQREAAEVNLKNAEAVREASEARLQNGLATLPDVLEARSAAAQAEYDLQSTIGQQQIAFGDLATTLTAPLSSVFKIQSIDDMTIPEELGESPEEAIEHGLAQRPDLLQHVAEVRAANAEIKGARSAFYPTLSFAGHDGWLRAFGEQSDYPPTYAGAHVYDAQLNLNWTLFDGLKRERTLARAKAEREAAIAEVNDTRDEIADQVWRAYANTQTAFRQRTAAAALLASSQESYNASLEAYTAGVRNILDVLAAQRTLAQARSSDIAARTGVLANLAELAFRTGTLLTNHAATVKP